eukprot:403353222
MGLRFKIVQLYIEKGMKEGLGGMIDQDKSEFYFGNWQKNQKNGFGILFKGINLDMSLAKNQRYISVFKGFWLNNQKHGLGIYQNERNDIVLCHFEKDQIRKESNVQIKYQNGDVYVGQLVQEKRCGKGEWEKDLKHGKGKLTLNQGQEVQGEFQNDQFCRGTYIDQYENIFKNLENPDDEKLDGQFINNKLYGYGSIEYKNKERYEGMLKDGKRCGQGKMIYNQVNLAFNCLEQSEYKGDWRLNLRQYLFKLKSNFRHGFGIQNWADGSSYEGNWSMDKRTHGKMKMIDGTVYEGPFLDDKYHGKGVIKFLDYNTFTGNFHNGKCPQFGMMGYKDGRIYLGNLRDFRKSGVGCILEVNGDFYEGEFQNDSAIGIGCILYKNGDYFTGFVQDQKKEGGGRLHEKLKNRYYEGKFYQDKKEGEGYYIFEDGRVYCGLFKNDIEEGTGEYINSKSIRQIESFNSNYVNEKLSEMRAFIHQGMRELAVDIQKIRMERIMKKQ